jgi:hypothetical protein
MIPWIEARSAPWTDSDIVSPWHELFLVYPDKFHEWIAGQLRSGYRIYICDGRFGRHIDPLGAIIYRPVGPNDVGPNSSDYNTLVQMGINTWKLYAQVVRLCELGYVAYFKERP